MPDPVNAANMTFYGKLNEIRWEKEDADAMDFIFERASKNPLWIGTLDADAKIGNETGLRHYTHKNGVTVFFRWGNRPSSHLGVYAVGRHKGNGDKSNKQYELNTFESGTKPKYYTFALGNGTGIPQVIHFIWLGSELPEKYKKNLSDWKKYNPTIPINLWTDNRTYKGGTATRSGISQNMHLFGKKHGIIIRDIFHEPGFSTNLYEKESGIIPRIAGIEQDANWGAASDILRVQILIRYGGIYCDTDIFCCGSLDRMPPEIDLLLQYEENELVSNNIMAFSPGHSILIKLKTLQEEGMNKVYTTHLQAYMTDKKGLHSDRTLLTTANTGPLALTEAIGKFNRSLLSAASRKKYQFPLKNLTIRYDHSWFEEIDETLTTQHSYTLSNSYQTIFPVELKYQYAMSHEPLLLNGMKVIFDQPVGVSPVNLESKDEVRRNGT